MRKRLLLSACILLLFCGCSVWDTVNRPVDLSEAEKQAQLVEQTVIDLKHQIASLHEQLDAAKAIADASQSETAQKLTASLLIAARAAEAALPEVQARATQAREIVTKMKEKGPTMPLWAVVAGLLVPFVAPLAQRLPIVGPIAAPILGSVAQGFWDRYATKEQKAADDQAAARAKALDYQVDVTHNILAALPNNVRKDQGIDELLQKARLEQIDAGVHDTLQRLVVPRELTAAVNALADALTPSAPKG